VDILLHNKIRGWFDEAVALEQAPEELKRSLKTNPRVQLFFDNLTVQICEADKLCTKRGLRLKESTIQTTVYDMTKIFLSTVEAEAKRRYESDLDKAARAAEASKAKAMDDFLSGGTDNEYAEELGLINEEVKVKDQKDFKKEEAAKA
jgi:hypothetical protein